MIKMTKTIIGSVIPKGTVGSVLFIGTGAKLAQDTSLFWDNTNKRLGIGTSAPSATIHISRTIVNSSDFTVCLNSSPFFTGAGNGPEGFLSSPTFNPSATITTCYGFLNDPVISNGAGKGITNLIAGYSRTRSSAASAGTIANCFGSYVAAPSYAGSKPTNQYGFYAVNQGLSGITTSYALYLAAQSGSTTNYAIYSDGGQSYHKGNLGIGIATPTATLNLKAGTATASTAPLKFTTGTLLTVAEDGVIEYLTNQFYIRNDGLTILSDAKKLIFGAGSDMSIDYDGAKGNIRTDLVGASDLNIDCGTDKTLVLEESVWDDIQFATATGKVPAANFPDFDTFTTNTREYKFDVDDYIDLEANEVTHSWKEGTTVYPHVHVALNGANASGSTQYAKFTVFFAYADKDEVWTETSDTVEIAIPTGTADLTHKVGYGVGVALTNNLIETQVKVRLKRIAATTGTEYPNHIFVTQTGLHAEKDTMGSRTLSAK